MKKNWLSWAMLCMFGGLPLANAQINSNKPQTINSNCETTYGHNRDAFEHNKIKQPMPILAYDYVHERDVMWEKRIWREIDLREKMNHHFSNAKEPLVGILLREALDGNITLYSTMDDQFTTPLAMADIRALSGGYDTIPLYDPITLHDTLIVVYNELDLNDVKRFRIKEVWFFDSERSSMGVRMLGIAPIIDRFDDAGNYIASMPMFWAYYPDLRPILAQYKAFNPHNDAAPFSWDDILEARYFASYIVKENNNYDRRIKDYLSGVDALLEGERIHQGIFNFEQDLWSN